MIINDLGTRKLPPIAAEDLLELIIRRYERALTIYFKSTGRLLGKLLGDTSAGLLDRLFHHAHVIICGA